MLQKAKETKLKNKGRLRDCFAVSILGESITASYSVVFDLNICSDFGLL